MTFVREVISKEEDKNLHDGLRIVRFDERDDSDPRVARLGLTTWVIDRERSIYMCGMGGGLFEKPVVYQIVLPEGRAELDVYETCETLKRQEAELNSDKSYIYHIEAVAIAVQPTLKHKKREVLALFKEALAAEKGVGVSNYDIAVEVTFPSISQE